MGNFYTDTIQYDKRFNSTERISDILLLEPVTRKIVQSIIEQAKLNGLDLMVSKPTGVRTGRLSCMSGGDQTSESWSSSLWLSLRYCKEY